MKKSGFWYRAFDLYYDGFRNMTLGRTFVVEDCQQPEGMCDSAWETLLPWVKELAEGGGDFFDGWMKNPHSAMISCNDGFRPVSFLVETME